ncbi:MAG: hypothetical protein ALMCE001_08180 [Methanocorpusculum sp. MCE]|nr:MAG: hypothetical protein ALMCE001_08180 [Methanocorpusculum sp. MCE]
MISVRPVGKTYLSSSAVFPLMTTVDADLKGPGRETRENIARIFDRKNI